MASYLLYALILLIFTAASLQSNETLVYRAAVVEYFSPSTPVNLKTIRRNYMTTIGGVTDKNAKNYEEFIKAANASDIDIIVFPEYGLSGVPLSNYDNETLRDQEYRKYYRNLASYVPQPDEDVYLCNSFRRYKQALTKISCAANKYKMYVVVNYLELVDCNPKKQNCSIGEYFIYNSNILFNRRGRVVAVYRKYNLLNDPAIDKPDKPEPSVFTTDFGVTFGQLIGSDILMEHPAIDYVKNPNVTNIVMPSRWMDELPLTGMMLYEAGWAYSADIHLLVSSHAESEGSQGIGMYAGAVGRIQAYRPKNPEDTMMLAMIPISRDNINMTRWTMNYFNDTLDLYKSNFNLDYPFDSKLFHPRYLTTEMINYNVDWNKKKICANSLCCEFSIRFKNIEEMQLMDYRYRAIVYEGPHKLSNGDSIGLEVCAYVICHGNEGLNACNATVNDNEIIPKFEQLEISRIAPVDRAFYVPVVKQNVSTPAPGFWFQYDEKNITDLEGKNKMITLKLNTDIAYSTYFGIFGRRFHMDVALVSKSQDMIHTATICCALLILSLAIVSMGITLLYVKRVIQRYFCIDWSE